MAIQIGVFSPRFFFHSARFCHFPAILTPKIHTNNPIRAFFVLFRPTRAHQFWCMSKQLHFALLRGQWAIQPEAAQNWLPIIANWLNGGQFPEASAPTANIVSFYNTKGQALRADDNNEVALPPDSVVVIENIGEMLKYGGMCSYGTEEIASALAAALASPNVAGAVLRMDSPGGQVVSIAPLLDVIQSSKKPIVTLADTCASAAYYVASATDYIMAENNISARFGSIGVVIGFADFTAYYEAKGIKMHEIYADQSTHKNRDYQEALKGNYEPIKVDMLNPIATQFQNHVKASRGTKLKLSEEGILAGRMFYAQDALKNGLIDGIGNLSAALAKVRQLATIKSFLSNP